MKKNKQMKHKLAAFVFAGSMATLGVAAAGVTLTSCNNKSSSAHIACANKSQTATTASTMTATWTFTLNSELASSEEISISEIKYSATQHVKTNSIKIESTSGKTVTVKGTFAPGDKSSGGTYDEGNCTFYIEFTVKKSSTTVWTEKVSDLKFSFSK